MPLETILIIILVLLSILLIAVFVLRPEITATRGGKIMAFLVLFALPLLCMGMGASSKLENSKTTRFCLSCHIMEPYGKSLRVDDLQHLAAAHFQNHRVPADEACYTCHTNYAMFGGIKAKLGGLRHIYVYYLRTPPAPENIRLYEPYNNRECLHCHAGARSFEEGAVHAADPDLLPAVKANKVSCVSSGCHAVVHEVGSLKDAKFWKGAD
jgi:nitrate/TMAO reductase-like tetraheme cytochrome c subunit